MSVEPEKKLDTEHVERDEKREAQTVVHDDDDGIEREPNGKGFFDMEMAIEGGHLEHELGSALKAIKIYYKGVLWSMLISLCIIMRAYDIEILGNFFALPAFRDKYGEPVKGDPAAGNQVPAKWQVALNMGNNVGQTIGSLLVNFPMERYGRRKTFAAYLVLTSCLVFMEFFAPSVQVLTVSQYLLGHVWAGFPIIVASYASEVLPLGLRPYLTGYINLCYVMGQFICTGIIRGFVDRTDEWAYRIPFAIQWFWPLVLLTGIYFAPESPWWLVRHDRYDEAMHSLQRLTVGASDEDLNRTVAMMIKTDQLEKELVAGVTYRDCFRGRANRRRTEIAIITWLIQDFSGNPVGYATYFFQQLGLTAKQSFDMGVGLNGLGFVGTCLAVFPIRYLGHRFTFMYGLALIVALLYIVALLSFGPDSNHGYRWAQSSILILVQFFWQITQGPLTYIIGTEAPSTRLRSHTLSLAAFVTALGGVVTTVLGPYFLNPGAINAGAKTQFLYAGISTFSVIWCWFRLPEMANRTFEELDLMFEREVPTRKFKSYVISTEDLAGAEEELVHDNSKV